MWTDILGTALLHSTWQFALIGLALYLALQLISIHKSQVRYLAGCAALSGCLLAFIGTLFWAASASVTPVASGYSGPRTGIDFAALLVIVWLTGSVIMALRNSISYMNISRLKASAKNDVPINSQSTFSRLTCIMGVQRARLLLSDTVKIPCTFGTIKPIVILPASLLTQMSSDEIEAILAHELAHIRRYDYLVNIVQQAILSVLYYHPAVHFISRQIDREREIACDDLALTATGHPRKLASALGKVTLFAHGAPSLAQSALGCDNDVAKRMTRLVNPASGLRQSRRLVKTVGTVIAASGVLLCANLATAYAKGGPDVQLTATESAQLRDDICNQIKKDGYYQRRDFYKSAMVRVDLHADTIRLNGEAVPDAKLEQYTRIIQKHGLKRGQGQYIYFNSQGSEIELGQEKASEDKPPNS